MTADIKIKFSNRREIRMGSPFYYADLYLIGIEIDLPKYSWQDKFAISRDKKWIVLINFDFTDNEPGFVFYIIDTVNIKVRVTNRIEGLINKVSIKNGSIVFNKFLYDKSKSKLGELCCNIDDELKIE